MAVTTTRNPPTRFASRGMANLVSSFIAGWDCYFLTPKLWRCRGARREGEVSVNRQLPAVVQQRLVRFSSFCGPFIREALGQLNYGIRRVCVWVWRRITTKRLMDSPQNKVRCRLDNAIIKKKKTGLADSFVMNGDESKCVKEPYALMLPEVGRCPISGKHVHDSKMDGSLAHRIADMDRHISSDIFGLRENVGKHSYGFPLVDMTHESRVGVIHETGWLGDFLCDRENGSCVYDLSLIELRNFSSEQFCSSTGRFWG